MRVALLVAAIALVVAVALGGACGRTELDLPFSDGGGAADATDGGTGG